MSMGSRGQGTTTCPQCGAAVALDTQVCVRCGHTWEGTPVGDAVRRAQKRRRTLLVLGTVVFVAVAIVVYGSILA